MKRSKCSVLKCKGANSTLGCKTCNIYLCSGECATAHIYDKVALCRTKTSIAFWSDSRAKGSSAHRPSAKVAAAKPASAMPAAAKPTAAKGKPAASHRLQRQGVQRQAWMVIAGFSLGSGP